MFDKKDPLISCLCVTDHRVHYLQRAVTCFHGQSYLNREMVIICKENDQATIHYIETFNDPTLRLVKVSATHSFTLGELRNISIENARGKYFCQWDDDDWYHRDRLKTQFEATEGNLHPSSMLTNLIIYDIPEEQAYFSNFRLWENSVFGLRSLYQQVRYESLNISEDHEFMNRLLITSRVYPTIASNLYIYVCHGRNTCNKEHFDMLFGNSQPFSSRMSQLIGNILHSHYSHGQASDLLNSNDFKQEINYFYARGQMLLEEKNKNPIDELLKGL
ncbi:glycosyltransferase [Fulvivirga sp. M361]|uniref:glycosyltransferase family 2 protein n=1 Tax=Fulvivirga sp. M361 TaxID=2594266 RepID=UPI00117BD3E4|nr:glycosyltransferase family 2 protein [Fulvivirga sp. M361]TRX60222.1 glycosyltransferase [Fulvivirga sp. M361]